MITMSPKQVAIHIEDVAQYSVYQLLAIEFYNHGWSSFVFEREFIHPETGTRNYKLSQSYTSNIYLSLKDIEGGRLSTSNAPKIDFKCD